MAVPTLTANSPSAGRIAWTAFSIQYAGVTWSVPASDTDKRYTWWQYNAGVPVLYADNELPVLAPDDLLLFLNKNGIPVNVQFASVLDGDLIVDGSILAKSIGAGQITTEHLDAKVLTAGMTITGKIQVGTHTWTPNEGLIIPGAAILPGGPTSQVVSITGTPTGGTFKLVAFGGNQTANIAYNASAATVETAIQALLGPFVGATVTGGPGPGTAWTIQTVGGASPLTFVSNLTGGTSPTVVVTQGPVVATLTASVTATSLTVQKDFNLLGNTNIIKGTLTLANGVTRPTVAPSAYQSWETVGVRSMPFGATDYGLTNHISDSNVLLIAVAFFGGAIHAILKSNGQQFLALASANTSAGSAYRAWCVNFNIVGGITTLGSNYFVLGQDSSRGNSVYLYKLDSNFDKLGEYSITGGFGPSAGRMTVSNDGTNVIVAMSLVDEIYMQTLTPALAYVTASYTSHNLPGLGYSALSYFGKGNFDFGSSKIVVAVEGNSNFVMDATAPHSRNGDIHTFQPANGHVVRGMWWDGTQFWSTGTDGSLYRHGRNIAAQAVTVSYTWADRDAGGTGMHETEETTTPLSFTRGPRTLLTVSTPDPPDSGVTAGGTPDKANAVGIYVGIAADSRRRQTSYGTSGYLLAATDGTGKANTSVTMNVLDTGTANPPSSNGFVGAQNSPGIIKTYGAAAGQGVIVNGDGSGQIGSLVWNAAGSFTGGGLVPEWRSAVLTSAMLFTTTSMTLIPFQTNKGGAGTTFSGGRVTITKAGLYYASTNITFSQSGGGGGSFQIANLRQWRSGVAIDERNTVGTTGGPGWWMEVAVTALFDCQVGDIIDVYGQSQYANITYADTNRCHLNVHRVGGVAA